MPRHRAQLLAVALFAACASSPPPKYELKLPERHARLPNGMRVILLPDPTTSLVEVDVRYEVGSAEDPDGKAGLAHLVEHLMFDQHPAGPDKPGLGALLREHSLAFNALTNADSTHYFTIARADELPNLIAIEAARLATGCETIDEKNFAREREVVRNEIRQREGTAQAQVWNQVLAAAYPPGHPYRHPTGGDDAQLASMALDDACHFFNDYYVPERATVIIAGNVTEDAARAAIDQYLASLPPRTGKPLVPITAPPLVKKTITIEAAVERPEVFAVWALPPHYTREDTALIYTVGSIAGRTGGYARELGGPRAPALALGIEVSDNEDAYYYKDTDSIIGVIERRAGYANWYLGEDTDLDRVKTMSVGFLTMAMESLTARTLTFADFAQFDAQGKYFAGELERARALDMSEVKSIVGRVLDTDHMVTVVVKPKPGAGGYARAESGFASPSDVSEEFPVDRSDAAYPIAVPADVGPLATARRFVLPNGLHVVLLPSEQPMPVMTASLVFRAGGAYDPPDKAGRAELAAEEMRAPGATTKYRRGDVFGEFGMSFSVMTRSDFVVYTIRSLNIYQELLLHGLGKMFVSPMVPRFNFNGLAKTRERTLKRRSVRVPELANKRWVEAVYGKDHPYARSVMVTPQTLRNMENDDLRAFVTKHYVASNATLVVTGRFDPAAAERDIREHFGTWDAGEPTPPIAEPAAGNGPTAVAIEGEDASVLQIGIAYPSAKGIDADQASRLVLARIISHRVDAVRGKLGASYGVSASYTRNVGPSVYEIQGAVDAERGAEALTAIRGSLDALRRGEGFLEDFVRARRAVLHDLLVDPNDSGSLAAELVEMAEFGEPPTGIDDLRRAVGTLTPKAVLALVNSELRPQAETLVAVGPHAKVQKMLEGADITKVTYEK